MELSRHKFRRLSVNEVVQTIDLGGWLLIVIAETIELGCCLMRRIV